MERQGIDELIAAVRADEQKKAELCSILSNIQTRFSKLEEALSKLDTRHKERERQLSWIEKVCTGIYNQLQTLTAILSEDIQNELSQSDMLKRSLEERALETNPLSIRAKRDVAIGIDGDLIGGNKDEDK